MIATVTLNPALDKTLQIPGFAVGQHARARVMNRIPAGKGINVARGLARLGLECVAFGLVGRGELEVYRGVLEPEGVECAMTPVDGVTRTNTTILDPEAGTTTHLREEGFTVDWADVNRMASSLQARLDRGQPNARIVFSGSLPPGVSSEQFVALVQTCSRADARIVLDTSGSPLREAVSSGLVDTVKPNRTELSQCLGREVGPQERVEAARELLDRVKTVLLTLGEDGAFLVRENQQGGIRCRLDADEVENTVGCGDAFLAGWLQACERELPWKEALQWGVAAGAACARGSTTVDYGREDVEWLLQRCEIL
jgi:1-phosphofructokinase